jgi:hypothetical protein
MKITKILLSAAVAGAMAFAASKASAVTVFPLVKLNISGTVTYTTTNTYVSTTNSSGNIKGVTYKTVGFNNDELIKLLNASPTFAAALTNQFHSVTSNSVPKGSYIVWNFDTDGLIITNKNGFSFTLDSNLSGDDFGYCELDYDYQIGTFTKNGTTSAGSEKDYTGIYFYFYDYNGNEIEVYGAGTLNWTYGAMTAGVQKTTVSASLGGPGYYSEVNFNTAVATVHASGSGTASDPIAQNPFVIWY